MSDVNDIENKVDEKAPSLFEKIVLRIFQPIFIALWISGFSGYLIWQLNLYRIAAITTIVVFFFAFRFFYNKAKNYRWAHNSRNFTNYDIGNTNDPRNPSSYGTPGSPYYAYEHFNRQNSRTTSSAFSDYDHYYDHYHNR